ncbi:hypothetical protein GCM10025771_18580 [Niveibacterium umoris]|uniref:Uncharacterized protein n=1 Tax=Niveibacterium umoris TaxID=1193620 RepID=A0A840BJZ9_9RHOO|nr:hypothetical protein [Niveibacterium umoris]MBB4012953.1 hypothetical protein [Niveibacterium umoris]
MIKVFTVTALIAISTLGWMDSRGYGFFDPHGSSSLSRSGSGGSGGRLYHK